ncbi:MAG: integrase family protein [Acidobacteriota bacterium]|nr:integrase family protein [Acidobacteriota bacterium]
MKDQRQRAKLTKKYVDAVTSSNGTRIIVTDTEVPGFRLVVGESTKTFILEKRITGVPGSAKKLKIGIYPVISPEEARETAKRWSILCRDGQDPTKVRVESRNGQTVYMPKHTDVVTLGKAVEWHIQYKKPCESTANGYRASIRTHMKDWLDKPLADILLHDLLARAHEIAARVSTKRARRVLADLRAIWNTAKAYSDTHDLTCPGSPLKLIKVGTLFPYNPRKVVIPFNRVGEFIHLLETWKDDTAFSTGQRRTFKLFLFSLFLGMRDTEARHLKWEYIDMDTGFFRLPGSVVKNKK